MKTIDRRIRTDEEEEKEDAIDHKIIQKEKEIIDEEYNFESEQQEETLIDTMVLWTGGGLIMTTAVLFAANEFRTNHGITTLLFLGLGFIICGLLWRYALKKHLRKEKSKIEEEEREIEEWENL